MTNVYSWPGGTYFCRVCGRQDAHEHLTALSELIDTDKLLRFLSIEVDEFGLSRLNAGWVAGGRRAGYIAHYNRAISSGVHATAYLALKALAKLVDEDTAKNVQLDQPSEGAKKL